MWRSFTTSSIYRLIMPLAHKNILQHKRKNMRRSWARNLMITCSNVYTYLFSFSLILLLLLLLLLYLDFILTFPLLLFFFIFFLFFFFCKHVHTINLFLIHLLYFFMHLYLGYTRTHETLSFCSLDIFFENIKMC